MASNASGLISTNALKTNIAPNFFSLISIPLDIIALKILNNGYDSICSFTEASTNPLRAWKLYKNKMIPFIKSKLNYAPRQHLINSYQPIGNVIAFRINKFPKKGKNIFFNKFGYFVVEKKRSIDIDNPFDLFLVRKILNH